MKTKRLVSICLVLVIMLCISMPVFAANPAEKIINGYTVKASYDNSSNTKISFHQVVGQVGSYPTGSGSLYYTYNGYENSVAASGTSFSSYWTGNATTTYTITHARTNLGNNHVSTR